jgi:hypothetical protein
MDGIKMGTDGNFDDVAIWRKQLLKMKTWKDEKLKTSDEWNEGWEIIIIIINDWPTSWNLGKTFNENSNTW